MRIPDDVLYDILIGVARQRGRITYGRLGNEFGVAPPFRTLIHALDRVSRAAHAAGRPMLSAVVVNRETGRPGSGFYLLAWDLGKTVSDEVDFWESEREKVYETDWPDG